MFIQIAAAALIFAGVQPNGVRDVSYDVTDTIVTPAQMRILERDPSATVTGEIVSQSSFRTNGSDVTLRQGEIVDGKPFAGTRIDVKTDETVTLTNNAHGRPASVMMKVDTTGTARGSYVIEHGGHREHHFVTVRRNG